MVVAASAARRRARAASWLPEGTVVVAGGERRQESVAAGVAALGDASTERVVLVHDAARPAVRPEVVRRVIEAAAEHGAAIPAVPVVETLKRVTDGRIDGTVDRHGVWTAQTPQGVRLGILQGRVRPLPPGRAGRLHRRSGPARGLYNSRACRPRRTRQPQGDPPGRSRSRGVDPARRRPAHRVRARTRIRSGPAPPSPSAGSRSQVPPGSTATPTATSCSMRSRTRCLAQRGSATSAGSTRRTRERRGASPAPTSWRP